MIDSNMISQRMRRLRTALMLLPMLLAWATVATADPAPVATTTAAAESTAAAKTTAASTEPIASDYRLGAGDQIRILVFQNPDLTLETRVSESGTIGYPLIGAVKIGGLTLDEAQKSIARGLRDGGFVKQPQVNIVLLAVLGNQVSVLGLVNKPGRFPLETDTRVSDAIALASGVMPTGSDTAVLTGMRDGKPFRKEIDIPSLFSHQGSEEDFKLQGGDVVYVPRAPVFYLYGEAQHPGSYRIERGMTVEQALATGGGPTSRGTEWRLRLDRRMPDGTVKRMTPEHNAPIQADDVLYVRESLF
ncbi:MAG TPA: polysaccharide export protein EpsE [Rhodocyclaceae bacterium]|nr:polysaccharide export protein EpsE [Rhodocyclaceae bacterium]